MDGRTVSVVIPVYNGERYLRETIESAYAQTRLPDEVLVVDDGSTDGTPELLRRLAEQLPPSFRWITQLNSGEAAARDRCVAEATGDLIAFLDHDDIWDPTKLERQLEHITAEDLDMSFTALHFVEGTKATPIVLEDWNPDTAFERLLSGCDIGTSSSVVVRKSCLAPGFTGDLGHVGCDWLMWLTVAANGGRVGYLPVPLVRYRKHSKSLSHGMLFYEAGCGVIERFYAQNPGHGAGRRRRAWWHLLAAIDADKRHDKPAARRHILTAARIRPLSVRPGWVRLLR